MATSANDDQQLPPPLPDDRHFRLCLKNYHAQEVTEAKSEKMKIGALEWMIQCTIHKQTYMKSNGQPTYWYNYLLRVTCLLPSDTKFYNCYATIKHGWFTHAWDGDGIPRGRMANSPTFPDSFKHRFTHTAPTYCHRITFDMGARPKVGSETVVYVKLHLEHDHPPVRPQWPDFTDSNAPWHDLKILCGPDKRPLYTSKSILSIVSPVFRALLHGEFREKDANSIVLPDTDYDDLRELLHHIYPNCRKPITESNVTTLLRMADRYLVDSVTQDCEEYLISYDPQKSSPSSSTDGGDPPEQREQQSIALSLEERMQLAVNFRLNQLRLECERDLGNLMAEGCSIR